MAESFELRDMLDEPRKAAPSTVSVDTDDADGTTTAWSLAASTLLLVLGLLGFAPGLLMLMTGGPRTLPTPLEAFLAFQFGLTLCGVSFGVLVNTPYGTLFTAHRIDDPIRSQLSHPLITPVTVVSLLMSLTAYNTTGIGMLSTVFSIITGIVGLWGSWTIVFGGSGRRSKLGADKRTSAFIFGNKSAASEIKKSARKKQS